MDHYPQPVGVLGPAHYPVTLLPVGSDYFGPDILPYKCSKILNPTHSSYIFAFEDGTDRAFRNVGI